MKTANRGKQGVALLGAVAALALPACGGDDEEKKPAAAGQSGAATEAGTTGATGAATAPPPAAPASTGAIEAEADRRKQSEASAKRRKARELKEEREGRSVMAAAVARSVLGLLDLSASTVKVRGGGRNVGIALAPEDACNSSKGDDERIAKAISDPLQFVRKVNVRVADSDLDLGDYKSQSCRKRTSSQVRSLYTASGRGFRTTRVFEVKSKRWTIEYGTDGRFFRALALKGKDVVRSIGKAEGGIGEAHLKGPGKFRLKISASGAWTMRVVERP